MNCEICNKNKANIDIKGDDFVISVCSDCYDKKTKIKPVREVKPMNPNNTFDTVDNLLKKGEQTISKPATSFFNSLGQYKGHFDWATLIYRLTIMCLLVGMAFWLIKIFMTGSMF